MSSPNFSSNLAVVIVAAVVVVVVVFVASLFIRAN